MSRSRLRLLLLLTLLLGLFLLGRVSGASSWLTLERVRALMTQAGTLGVLVFCCVFALGEILHVPGMIFVAAGIVVYGRVPGGALSFAAALFSVSVSFFVVRTLGGQALAQIRHPFMQRLLGHLDQRPVRTVALLRLCFILAPPLNYALALTSLRFRHYLAGSALGIAPWVTLAALFVEALVAWL